jgi:hypothetical protein
MAISEVCKIEVVQELDRLCLDKSVSRNEAYKKMATFYKDMVGVDVGWQTIKKKDQRARQVGTNVPSKQTEADNPPNVKDSRSRQKRDEILSSDIMWRLDELRESFDNAPRSTTDEASKELEDLSIVFRDHVKRLCDGQSQHQLSGLMLRSLVATAWLAFRFINLSVSGNQKVMDK